LSLDGSLKSFPAADNALWWRYLRTLLPSGRAPITVASAVVVRCFARLGFLDRGMGDDALHHLKEIHEKISLV
jgi:hypothetical protein